jgi:sarcosine oxidase subunit alpha
MSARLEPIPGEWIDRGRALQFRFEGQAYRGYAGDVVSSALWAAGARVLGRSFKYHRPRGVLSLANHDSNALLEDAARMNLRADVTPLTDGMELRAVNTAGGVARDRLRLANAFGALMPVGFYYKAFHRPRWAAAYWESLFRHLSGLGRVSRERRRERTAKRYGVTDVLVVGAGAAGLSAAIAAAEAGAAVLVVDENARPGGSLTYTRSGAADAPAVLAELLARAARLPNLEIRCGTVAAGYYADHYVPLVDAGRMTKLRARTVIVASGAIEQPAAFGNNDLPGIMLGSAAQRLIYRYAVRPMQRAVVLAANAEGYAVALDLHGAGVTVAAVIDLRPAGEPGELGRRVAAAGIAVRAGACIDHARGRRDCVAAVAVRAVGADGQPSGAPALIDCDGVAMSVGFAADLALLRQAGAGLAYHAGLEQFLPEQLPDGLFAAGRVTGVYGLADRLRDGERAGRAAAAALGFTATGASPAPGAIGAAVSHAYPIVATTTGKTFIDFDEDVQLADLGHAAQEGFDGIELLKRYATVGMGPSQGKHSNLNAARVLARWRREPLAATGVTTARPFVQPVPLSHLAGRGFHPQRRTPLHERHAEAGAVFFHAGDWLRPEYYARAGTERAALVREEARRVRQGVGMIDVGTLGKIDVYGPDAAELLERVYTGRFRDLAVGATRYAVMLDESGVVADDGVVARLAADHFYCTTTTTAAAAVYRELTRLNTFWRLDIGLANVTGARAAINLAGPRARAVLAPLTDIDCGAAAFPYLGVRQGTVAGVAARVLRVGFVGELGYEIHVAAEHAAAVWDTLQAAGHGEGLAPFGVEAQRRLRLEKAHLIVGQDTDGLTNPLAAGLGWAVKMDKPFFVGQRSLRIIGARPFKQRLVGFTMPLELDAPAPQECCLIIHRGEIAGRVTSLAESETLGRRIGLAYVMPDLAPVGTRLRIKNAAGELLDATVVETPFYDPRQLRQREGG